MLVAPFLRLGMRLGREWSLTMPMFRGPRLARCIGRNEKAPSLSLRRHPPIARTALARLAVGIANVLEKPRTNLIIEIHEACI